MKRVFRILLGALFCTSAISKLLSLGSFELYLFSFKLCSYDLCTLFARVLVGCELALGIGLLSGLWRRLVNWLSAAALAVFTAFLVWRIALGDTESCHCFGELLDMNPAWSLVKNAGFAVLLALGWKAEFHYLKNFKLRLSLTLLVLALSISTGFIINPPDFFYRMKGHVSSDLSEEKWTPYSESFGWDKGREVVLFMSPFCPYCGRCGEIFTNFIGRHNLDMEHIHIAFLEATVKPEDMEGRAIPEFFEAHTNNTAYDYGIIDGDDFFPMTNGSMPLVCLFEEGKLVREYDLFSLSESEIVDFLK